MSEIQIIARGNSSPNKKNASNLKNKKTDAVKNSFGASHTHDHLSEGKDPAASEKEKGMIAEDEDEELTQEEGEYTFENGAVYCG